MFFLINYSRNICGLRHSYIFQYPDRLGRHCVEFPVAPGMIPDRRHLWRDEGTHTYTPLSRLTLAPSRPVSRRVKDDPWLTPFAKRRRETYLHIYYTVQIDLGAIAASFQSRHGRGLTDAIRDETKGDQRRALVKVVEKAQPPRPKKSVSELGLVII